MNASAQRNTFMISNRFLILRVVWGVERDMRVCVMSIGGEAAEKWGELVVSLAGKGQGDAR